MFTATQLEIYLFLLSIAAAYHVDKQRADCELGLK